LRRWLSERATATYYQDCLHIQIAIALGAVATNRSVRSAVRVTFRHRPGKLVNTMGDKSPKNTKKSSKQRTDAKSAKDKKKQDAAVPARPI